MHFRNGRDAAAPVRVLYLDDDPVDQDLMGLYVRGCPPGLIDLVCVATLEEAADALTAGGVDIFLLDNRMPGIEDYRESLRLLPALGSDTRLIVTSSEIESESFDDETCAPALVIEKFSLRQAVRDGVFSREGTSFGGNEGTASVEARTRM
jgi:CheY-like chemotaxis protein